MKIPALDIHFLPLVSSSLPSQTVRIELDAELKHRGVIKLRYGWVLATAIVMLP